MGLLRQARPIILPILFAAAVIALWQAVVVAMKVPEIIMPAPGLVLDHLTEGFSIILGQALPTAREALTGYLISIVTGVILASLITYSDLFREAVFPNIVAFQLVPKIALAPLFIVWFGIGAESRVIFIIFVCFFPIMISTATGLVSAPRDTIRLARSLTATKWQIFTTIRVPYAIPYLFNGMKIAATMAMISVVVAEFLNSQQGLGFLILFANSKGDTALVLAAIVALCVIGLILFAIVAVLERLARRRFAID